MGPLIENPIELLEAAKKSAAYEEFLEKLIERGIEGVRKDYDEDSPKFKGSKEGFEACRGLYPHDLKKLLDAAQRYRQKAQATPYPKSPEDYWYWRCRELEIGWVCNCVSALLVNSGMRPIVEPTSNGTVNAYRILSEINQCTTQP